MKEKIKENKIYQIGLMIFTVFSACILLVFVIFNLDKVFNFVNTVIDLLSPFIIGFVFAYLLNPIVKFFNEKVFSKLFKKDSLRNGVSIFTTCTLFIGIILVLFYLIIPSLLESIEALALNIPGYIMDIKDYLISMSDSSEFINLINANYSTIIDVFNKTINNFIPKIEDMITILSSGLFGFVKVAFRVIMGFVISIYFLSDKDNFIAGIKKIIYGLFNVKVANRILENARHTNYIFGNFIVGKLLDGACVGFITFIFLYLLGFKEFSILIGVTIGLTNMIPYFGPYIGTIPSALLILMDESIGGFKICLIFVIFIIALQQIDSYIIEPRLCGSKTGLKSFWVLASILFFGDVFGIVGLLLGVPIFALIYGYLHNLITLRLKEKNLPSDTIDYINLERINSKSGAVVKSE